jgi:hypothetical protein
MIEIRGPGEALDTGGKSLGAGFGDAMIRIYPERVNSFGLNDAESESGSA